MVPMDSNLSIEEALRTITEKAAVMRFLSDSASHANDAAPDSAVLSDLGTMCADIEALTSRVKGALPGTVLNTPLPSPSTAGAAKPAQTARQRRHAR
jgi:hypothetical protein